MLGHEGGAPVNEIGALLKETLQGSLPLLPSTDTEKVPSVNQEADPTRH